MKPYLIVISLCAVIVPSIFYLMSKTSEGELITFVTGEIIEGNIENLVISTDTLEARNTIVVGSQLSGQISDLYVDFNDVVTAGQILARIDPRTFEARVVQQQADVNVAVPISNSGRPRSFVPGPHLSRHSERWRDRKI